MFLQTMNFLKLSDDYPVLNEGLGFGTNKHLGRVRKRSRLSTNS